MELGSTNSYIAYQHVFVVSHQLLVDSCHDDDHLICTFCDLCFRRRYPDFTPVATLRSSSHSLIEQLKSRSEKEPLLLPSGKRRKAEKALHLICCFVFLQRTKPPNFVSVVSSYRNLAIQPGLLPSCTSSTQLSPAQPTRLPRATAASFIALHFRCVSLHCNFAPFISAPVQHSARQEWLTSFMERPTHNSISQPTSLACAIKPTHRRSKTVSFLSLKAIHSVRSPYLPLGFPLALLFY